MKKLLMLIMSVSILMLQPVHAFAAQANERPDIKTVFEGKSFTGKDVPLIANGRTMLPLREALCELGVINDDSHIIWNAEDGSVTVHKDLITIVLKVDSDTAYINGEPYLLEAAPLNYNGRVYLPVRFIADVLGEKVVWDGKTSTVYIRNKIDFENISRILDDTNKAMSTVGKTRFESKTSVTISLDNSKLDMNYKSSGMIDRLKKSLYMLVNMQVMDKNVDSEYVIKDGVQYKKNKNTKKWETVAPFLPGDFLDFDEGIPKEENACAGLVLEKSSDQGEIILKGNIYPGMVFEKSAKTAGISDLEPDNAYMEEHINSDTKRIESIAIKVSGYVQLNSVKRKVEAKIEVKYSDCEGAFLVPEP
ncbi:MAG TPA: copper amine oxidase N-terminal domain-containing protein [Clostridia bacterium]